MFFWNIIRKKNILSEVQLKNAFVAGLVFNTELHTRKINVPEHQSVRELFGFTYSLCTHLLPSHFPSLSDFWIYVFVTRGSIKLIA